MKKKEELMGFHCSVIRKKCGRVIRITIALIFGLMFTANANSYSLQQQQKTVTGVITDQKGLPLPGVSVVVKGTNVGTVTNPNGGFTLSVPSNAQTLQFSFVGMKIQEVPLDGRVSFTVVMEEEAIGVGEVVVTALGIDRNKDALGYSVSTLEELERTAEYSIASALSGKVAGVNVSQVASGAGGSSKIIIRGNNSLVGNSQPLYVIDGIPMNNNSYGEAGRWGGTDYGDGLTSISQDDVESMTILKGPNAASLYGQRGSNGVILITTKSGKLKKGFGVSYNSSFSVGNAAILPDFQNEYGQGFNGNFTHIRAADGTIYSWKNAQSMGITGMPKMSAGRDQFTRGSWGAPYNGKQHEDQFGNVLPYDPQSNTFQDFFETETKLKNTVNVTGGNENVNYYFSFSNMHVNGYVPANEADRNSFTLRTMGKITSKIQVDVKVNYSIEQNKNRPLLSDGVNNPVYLLISQPRSMYSSALKDYTWTAEQLKNSLGYGSIAIPGAEKTYATNGSTANQYWTIDNVYNSDRQDRLLASLNLKYDITEFLALNLRGGTDTYTEQRYAHSAIGTRRTSRQKGDMSEIVNRVREDNYDALLSYKYDSNKDFKIEINAGGSHQRSFFRQVGFNGVEFQIPNLFTISNTLTQSPVFGFSESAINSIYGAAQFSYKSFAYLDFTGRNDWSSTLPLNNNSFFYPSVSASFVLTEAIDISRDNILNYLKFRGSIAQAGNSGSPYQLFGEYSLSSETFGGRPVGNYSNVIPDPNLQNEMTTSYEFGVDLKLFQNRFGIDFTYYSTSTENQILSVPLPRSTNFSGMRINSGEITNKGVELLLTAIPIKLDNGFVWETSLNFASNKNEVVSLADGVDNLILGADRNVNVVAIPGKPFGQLYGTSFSWQKDDSGNRLIDPSTGLPIRSNGKLFHQIGNALPDWTGGFSNTFSYKGIRLGMLIDISQGGQIFSQSTREQILYGTTKKTLAGRDGTYVAKGVIAEKNSSGKWVSTGVTNTMQVTAQDYWNSVANTKDEVVSEELLNDASYISMREMTLSYKLPSKIFSNAIIRNIEIGLFGRNLFYFERHTDGFAPEASAFNGSNSSLGLESTSLPLLRNFGININIQF